MSRFGALDLSTLPEPSAVIDLDFSAILAARLAELEAQLSLVFDAPRVSEVMGLARNIAASPMRYLNEAAAARELYMSNQINQAIRSVFLSTASGGDLDQIGATRGVVRKVLDGADPENIIYEGDEVFRARIQLVIEAFSPHGTEGSYVYWALEADDRVLDVVVYGPNDAIDPPVMPAEPKMVILSSEVGGVASADLLDIVFDGCSADARRPVGDKLEVVSAVSVPYQIQAELLINSSASSDVVLSSAQATVDAFIDGRLRIGRTQYRTSLAAALTVDGVVDVVLLQPAADLVLGPFEAPYCTGVNLTTRVVSGGWRDV